jgi:hypothetical protein
MRQGLLLGVTGGLVGGVPWRYDVPELVDDAVELVDPPDYPSLDNPPVTCFVTLVTVAATGLVTLLTVVVS